MIMSPKKIIFLIFFIALASGFFWNQKIFGQPIGADQILYDLVAQNLQQDVGIEPLYPLFLAGIYAVFGHNYDAVRTVQIILFALTIVLIYLLAEKVFNKKIAIWSSSAAALFYGLANQAGSITTETLFTFLLMVTAYLIHRAGSENKSFWLLAGAALGLAALTRGIAQFLPIFIVINVFVVYCKKLPMKKIGLIIGIFLAGFLLVLLPWTVGNRLTNAGAIVAPRAGEMLFARAELMENIYANYPAHFIGHFLGYYFVQKIYPDINSLAFRETPNTERRMDNLLKENKNYGEIDRILTIEVKNKIFGAPHKYILMSLLDFVSFNSPIIPRGLLWQNTLTIHTMFAEGRHPNIPEWAKVAIILSIRFTWFALLFFAIYGLIKNFKNWDKIGWLFLIIIYFNLAYGALHAIPRYALPIYPFYIILAVVGLNALWQKQRIKKP